MYNLVQPLVQVQSCFVMCCNTLYRWCFSVWLILYQLLWCRIWALQSVSWWYYTIMFSQCCLYSWYQSFSIVAVFNSYCLVCEIKIKKRDWNVTNWIKKSPCYITMLLSRNIVSRIARASNIQCDCEWAPNLCVSYLFCLLTFWWIMDLKSDKSWFSLLDFSSLLNMASALLSSAL